jgi:flotillin
VNKITGDIAKMAAQVPALFEALSGMNVYDLISKVRLIGDKSPKPPIDGGGSDDSPKAKAAGSGN